MTRICTSDDFAVAIVAAARLQGEDPEAIAKGKPNSRARWYALAALLETFGGNDPRALALGVGIFSKNAIERAKGRVRDFRSGKYVWWDDRRVSIIVQALDDGRVPLDLPRFLPATPAEPVISVPPARPISSVLRDEGTLPFGRPVSGRRRANITAAIMGDPEPGRSALAQRQTEKVAS